MSTSATATLPAGSWDGPDAGRWIRVCAIDRILPDTGWAAMVNGYQVAVFKLLDGRLFALDNHDPCSGANVLARGILGDVAGLPVVASPIYKQRFDLMTGQCLDAEVAVMTQPVRECDGWIEVQAGGAIAGSR